MLQEEADASNDQDSRSLLTQREAGRRRRRKVTFGKVVKSVSCGKASCDAFAFDPWLHWQRSALDLRFCWSSAAVSSPVVASLQKVSSEPRELEG